MNSSTARPSGPHAFVSTYAPRLRSYGNALIAPVVDKSTVIQPVRTTKRGTTAINYAEDGYDDDDFEDSEGGPRRPTGLRSLRRDDSTLDKAAQQAQLGKELDAAVDVQPIWREWISKQTKIISEKALQIQSILPLTLIPIRIDLDIAPFRPEAALPLPREHRDLGIDENLPMYRPSEITPTYRLKDAFLWNLHEALTTPDQFAKKFVEELDLPADRKQSIVVNITQQIRQQLEDYAGVALHPLFHSTSSNDGKTNSNHITVAANNAAASSTHASKRIAITTANGMSAVPSQAATPGPDTNGVSTPTVSAAAEPLAASASDDIYNPDDTYRCIVSLNVNLLNKLYSDKFEWSLLHPPGVAEQFAKQTCADLGLSGEWVAAIAHAIYEAVLKLKKDVCENGGLLLHYGEIDNDAAHGTEAGWRYEPEHLAEDWEPKLEVLSKEEIEKREGDRERQLRRVRRETARYSSTAAMQQQQQQQQYHHHYHQLQQTPASQNDYFAIDSGDQPMGRGERSKKKRRFRSLSPLARDTPDAMGGATAAVAGYGGGVALGDAERQTWNCKHCRVWGSAVWAVRDGPLGPRTLCHNCGFLYERDKRLPPWTKDFFANEQFYGSRNR